MKSRVERRRDREDRRRPPRGGRGLKYDPVIAILYQNNVAPLAGGVD